MTNGGGARPGTDHAVAPRRESDSQGNATRQAWGRGCAARAAFRVGAYHDKNLVAYLRYELLVIDRCLERARHNEKVQEEKKRRGR